MIHKVVVRNLLYSMLALWVSACGSFEVGIEHIPPGDMAQGVNWQATAEALQAEATRRSGEAGAASPQHGAVAAPTLVPALVPAVHDAPMVAYVQGGDIWVRSIPEGEAVRLTFDGRNQSPQWSASGAWLTFIKDQGIAELWAVRADGSDAQQIDTGVGSNAYAWSPVEDKLTHSEGGSVRVYVAAEGAQLVLASQFDMDVAGANHRVGEVAWSPNGQRIAFTLAAQRTDAEADGLWVLDVASNEAKRILASEVPDKGEFVLRGWSGDGEYLLYWQAPILSASMLADGVPLYRVPAAGGAPQVMAEAVLVHEDNVQSQPNGLPQVAIVVGSGREMWHNKQLHSVLVSVLVSGMQAWELTQAEQAVSSPAWSPAGNAIAYIGAPDVEGVVGGPEAQAALTLRQLWIVVAGEPPRPVNTEVNTEIGYREEAPQWIDDRSLLVARMDLDGRVSLWQVDTMGEEARQVVEEITPAPEWFGFYGHIRWRDYFSLWRPQSDAQMAPAAHLPPTAVPPAPGMGGGRKLADFLAGLRPELTGDEALALWGEPEVMGGSGQIVYEYLLEDGLKLRVAFAGAEGLASAHLLTPDNRLYAITPLEEALQPTATGAAMPATATPTPASMDAVTPTATPLPVQPPAETRAPEPTTTPLPTAPMPETPTPVP